MKFFFQILFLQLIVSALYSQQFYLRGEVRDEGGSILPNVNIQLLSTGYSYRTGNYGSFGIPSTKEKDTLLFTFRGYQNEKIVVHADKYISVILKLLPAITTNINQNKLASLTKDLSKESQKKWFTGNETYASLVENNFIEAKKYPATGIALNIDRASYSNIRRFINMGLAVPTDAVRIDEMLNNFDFGYEQPAGKELFKIKTSLGSCPWNKNNQLFFINVFSKKLELDSLPPTNLVFLIDVSSSMSMPNRLPLLKSAFHMLVMNLRAKDTISIIFYGGAVGVMLFPTGGDEKEKIYKAIDELTPGGSTPGEAGIKLAYQIAKKQFIKGGNNRIILATDGDFNVGLQTEEELDELISRHKDQGIYLTCLGVGMGNYKDSKIQTLARKGNGNFAYMDTFMEAEKVLMKEFTKTLYTIADDVYMNVKFNPELIKKYRLIGFDNKIESLTDSTSFIEGGEIGSGHSMILTFEFESNANTVAKVSSGNFAEINLRYKMPLDSVQRELNESFPYTPVAFNNLEPTYRFASSIIMFGLLIKKSPFAKKISWNETESVAKKAADPDDINQSQFVELVAKSRLLYTKTKKKKND